MGIHNYTRTLVSGFWDTNVGVLSQEIKTALPAKPFTLRANDTALVADFVDTLTGSEVTTLDDTVAAHQLVAALTDAKAEKIKTIDANTGALIGKGFEFPAASGIMYSLSDAAQRTLIAADQQRSDPTFTYPVIWNSKDDLSEISLADATELHNFVLTAVGTTRAWLDSGTGLKSQVRAATTVAEVEAIVDNR